MLSLVRGVRTPPRELTGLWRLQSVGASGISGLCRTIYLPAVQEVSPATIHFQVALEAPPIQALRSTARQAPVMGPLSLVAQEALPVEATRISEPILPGPEEPAPRRTSRRFLSRVEPRRAPELAGLHRTPVSRLSIVDLGIALWAKHWLRPTPCCDTLHHLERRNTPRGDRKSTRLNSSHAQ